MKNHNHLTKYFFPLSICLTLLSCTGMQTKGSPIAGGQVIDMGIYTVEAPLGDGWKVKTDKTQGRIEFNKGGSEAGFTFIYIHAGFLNPGTENQTEDEIANKIFGSEEKDIRERGATRSYYLKDLSKEVTTIGGKKLHVMNYTITDRSRIPMDIKYAMYLYLPPDLRKKRVSTAFGLVNLLKSEIQYMTLTLQKFIL
jgi:hypothetical protein